MDTSTSRLRVLTSVQYRTVSLTSTSNILGIVLLTQWDLNSSHSVLPTCICSSSSPHPPRSSPESSKNKRLHSPGYLEVKRMKDWAEKRGREMKTRRTLFFLRCIYASFCSSGCFLHSYMVLSPRGVLKPPPLPSDRCFLLSLFSSPSLPSVSRFSSPIILSLELLWDVAEDLITKETKKMIREGKQGHLQFISPRRQERGKRKEEDEGEDEIRGEKQRGTGEERINNPAKKMNVLSWQPRKWESKKLWI